MKIAVAMSGGVDSSTAAALLVEAGHEVIGLTMKTHALAPKANRACCTPDDLWDARRVADQLQIPFYVLNYEELFTEAVIKPFAEAYLTGRTPNPCIECNDKVKFRPLLERAELLGAEKLATGHYARIVHDGGKPYLARAFDSQKDQSYFLYRLSHMQLDKLLFPLGEMDKEQVRAEARRLNLKVAEKSESQEICFVGQEGYAKAVERLASNAAQPGLIVDQTGKVLGEHQGVHHFTVGQRKGLRIAHPEPLYVTGVDANSRTVQVGNRENLLERDVVLTALTFETLPDVGLDVLIQQRYRENAKPGVVLASSKDQVVVRLHEAAPRSAPGQAAVVYSGDRVLGGGTL